MVYCCGLRTHFLGALLLFLPIPLASMDVSLDVVINNGSTQTLRATLGEDMAFAASAFVETNNIYNGAGCTADAECVAKQLLEALERQAVAEAATASRVASSLGGESINGEAPVETIAPGLPLWSNAGWHENGHPFAAHTPGAAATARSEARLQPLRARFADLTANAFLALAQLRSVAQERADVADAATFQPTGMLNSKQVHEADFSILEIQGSTDHNTVLPAGGGGESRRALGGCSGPVWQSKVVLAIGIISAPKNLQNRMAIRRTWLKALPESLDADTVAARFFIGLPLTSSTSTAAAPSPVGAAGAEVKEDDPQQLAVAAEALEFGDVALLNLADRYMATPMKVVSLFKWGVQQCGAWWVLRANDDVYLRLPETMRVLASHPPANVVAGLFLDGANMHVPRPEHYGSTQEELYRATKSWTFTRSDYPSDALPTFPQGNAVILSRDLAAEVASLSAQPWLRLTMADDVLLALLLAKYHPSKVVISADYDLEGTYTRCRNTSHWHFNLHPEHMYDLFHNQLLGFPSCHRIARFCCG